MSDTGTHRPFPLLPLAVVGSVIALTIAVAAYGSLTGMANDTPNVAALAARDLFFHDLPDGGVAVIDADHQSAPLVIVPPASNGFLRATVRGLAQQRLRQADGPQVPFRLTEWADGRLTLEDPVTHRKVEMEAFGVTNEAVFAHIMIAKEPS